MSEERQYGAFRVPEGVRLTEAANSMIKGVQEIQKLVTTPEPYAAQVEIAYDHLVDEREKIATICERLVGVAGVYIADLTKVEK